MPVIMGSLTNTDNFGLQANITGIANERSNRRYSMPNKVAKTTIDYS